MGNIRVVLAQLNSVVGDLEGNVEVFKKFYQT